MPSTGPVTSPLSCWSALTLRAALELGKVHLRGQPALVERLRGKGAAREDVGT